MQKIYCKKCNSTSLHIEKKVITQVYIATPAVPGLNGFQKMR